MVAALAAGLALGAELTGELLDQHRLMSRFPMGIPPEALRSLLRQSGQSELKVVKP